MTVELTRVEFRGLDGIRLVSDVAGDPAGQPIILLHGGGQTRHSWGAAQLEFAASGFRVISYDARGHGDSDWASDADYGLSALAEDLRAICATLARPPVLIGASMGGATSLALVGEAADPALARALVLVDVTPRMEAVGVARVRSFMAAHAQHGFASLEEAADAIAAYYPERKRPTDTRGLMKNLRQRADGRLRWHWDPQLIQPGRHTEPPEFQRRLQQAASKVRIPALLVRGMQSDLVSQQSVDELRDALVGLEVAEVGGAGHMVAGDRNDAFNRDVSAFLRRHVQPN